MKTSQSYRNYLKKLEQKRKERVDALNASTTKKMQELASKDSISASPLYAPIESMQYYNDCINGQKKSEKQEALDSINSNLDKLERVASEFGNCSNAGFTQQVEQAVQIDFRKKSLDFVLDGGLINQIQMYRTGFDKAMKFLSKNKNEKMDLLASSPIIEPIDAVDEKKAGKIKSISQRINKLEAKENKTSTDYLHLSQAKKELKNLTPSVKFTNSSTPTRKQAVYK